MASIRGDVGLIFDLGYAGNSWCAVVVQLSAVGQFQLPENITMLALSTPALSVLQLLLAKALVERFCRLPVNSRNPWAIIQFLIISGPITCLFTTLLAVAFLASETDISSKILWYIAMNRWAGDAVSIIFLTPVFLFFRENKYARRAKKPLSATIATIMVVITIYIVNALVEINKHEATAVKFEAETRQLQDKFRVAQTTIHNNLVALRALIRANPQISKQQFNTFAEQMLANNMIEGSPLTIRALGWAPLVMDKGRQPFEDKLKQIGAMGNGIKQLTDKGFQRAKLANYYIPIQYLYPFEMNRAAIGLDLNTHAIVSPAVKKAIMTKNAVSSDIIALAQQQHKSNAVVVYMPVFAEMSSRSEEAILGVVEVVLELDLMINDLFKSENNGTFGFNFQYVNHLVSTEVPFDNNAVFQHQADSLFFDRTVSLYFSSTDKFDDHLATWTNLTVLLIGAVIGVICVMFVFFIVTFNAALSKKVADSTKQLLLQNQKLDQANKTKNLFLANTSHEYRTPLNAIVGFTEIAQRENDDQAVADYLKQIEQSSKVLLGIVNDVLDASKMQAGELKLEKQPFNPVAAAKDVAGMLSERAEQKSILLKQEYPDQPPWLLGDETRFKQIVINLVNNAIKFTEQGQVSIQLSFGEFAGKARLSLLVKDTGIGIAQDKLEKLFEPFAQAEDSTSRKYGGTGLGLAIVSQLSELMSGSVKVRSEMGKGSEFEVELILPETEAPEQEQDDYKIIQSEFQKANVLVVEDNKINQLVVQKQLQTLNIDCDLADDGEKALGYLQNTLPDLILMDLQMPVMDGFTVSKHIKNTPHLRNIPIVILSASVGKEEREKAAKLGITDFINKPFSQQDLAKVLGKYLKVKSAD